MVPGTVFSAVGIAGAAHNIVTGQATWWDALAILPFAGRLGGPLLQKLGILKYNCFTAGHQIVMADELSSFVEVDLISVELPNDSEAWLTILMVGASVAIGIVGERKTHTNPKTRCGANGLKKTLDLKDDNTMLINDEVSPLRVADCEPPAIPTAEANNVLAEVFRDLPILMDDHRDAQRRLPELPPHKADLIKPSSFVSLARETSSPPRRHGWLQKSGSLWLAAWLIIAGTIGYRGLTGSASPSLDSAAQAAVRPKPQPKYRTKNIEDIREGDLVLAANPETGELAPRRVLQSFQRTSDHLRILTFRNHDGSSQRIETTDEHPFWVSNRHDFVNANDLVTGDQCTTPTGEIVTLTSTNREEHLAGMSVFNFEVEGLHTYFVQRSALVESPILVHNANCTLPTGLRNASTGLQQLFSSGSVRGSSIIGIRNTLTGNGFTQGLTRNRSGYLFQNGLGEQVRVMRRNGGWDIRIFNRSGNYLDEFGNVAAPSVTHGVNIFSF